MLADLAADVGLDRAEALDALVSDAYVDDVKNDEQNAGTLGIQGVPFFIFDGKFAVSGAQPIELFKQALDTAWKAKA